MWIVKRSLSWGVGGIPTVFFTAPSDTLEELNLTCCVCTEVLRDPVFANGHPDCQHTMCRSCVECYMSTSGLNEGNPGCPMCGLQIDFPLQDNSFARRQVTALKVSCPRCRKVQHCSDDGEFVLNHLASCFKLQSLDELPQVYLQIRELEELEAATKTDPLQTNKQIVKKQSTKSATKTSRRRRSAFDMITLSLAGIFK
jgi:hypothetical protein